MSDPAWKPNESSATIMAEATWLQGGYITTAAYGSVVTLSVQCFAMLVKGPFKTSRLSRDGPLIVYVVLIFILSTTFEGSGMLFSQRAFVNDRNIPGGPFAYEIEEWSLPLHMLINSTTIVCTFLSDALLLWRCTVMYMNTSIPHWVVYLVTATFWITEFVFGVLVLVQMSSQPILTATTLNVAFWCYSLALNIIATIVIVGRLLAYRFRLSATLGKQYAVQYTNIIAMIVESEMLYTAFMILYIIPFIRHDALAYAFLQGPSQVQAVAALMIVYRVAQGKAWTKDSYSQTQVRSGRGGAIQLDDFNTSRSTVRDTEPVKSTRVDIQVMQEVHFGEERTRPV